MGNSRCTVHSVYVSGQKIQLDERSVWVRLPDGAVERVRHWSSFPSETAVCLVLPFDAVKPSSADFDVSPAEGFRGVSSSGMARGRGGRASGRYPDLGSPAVSGTQVQTDIMRQAEIARQALPADPSIRLEVLKARKAALKERAQFDSTLLGSTPSSTHTTFSRVPLDLIVSRGSGSSWDEEFDSRQGRILEVAEGLLTGTPEVSEKVFHLASGSERVRVKAFEGPAGPIYTGLDGSHRSAAAIVAGMEAVYADVERIAYPAYVHGPMNHFARLQAAGLIRGQWEKNESGQDVFKVENAVLPWIFGSPESVESVSRRYLEAYPDGLDSLPVPTEVLTDAEAFREYLDTYNASPAPALVEHLRKVPTPAPVEPGETLQATGLAASVRSLKPEPKTSRLMGTPETLALREEKMRTGLLLAFEDSSGAGVSKIRDVFGNVGVEADMVPPGWAAEWVLDHSLGRPYGSNYRVVVYDKSRYRLDFDGKHPGRVIENVNGVRVVEF